MRFTRITKAAAIKRFVDNLPVYFCPCKLSPCSPWNVACLIIRDKERGYSGWTTFEQAYNAWSYYNTSYETGYYAHYYMESSQLVGSK